MTDWEKRARELCWVTPLDGSERHVERALQLGREMAAEARERYEEQCELTQEMRVNVNVYRDEAVALRKELQSQAADERAEKIAQRLETALMGDLECSPGSFGRDAACIARSTISKPEPLPGVDRERFMHGQFPKGVTRAEGSPGLDESRIRADEREKIAQMLRDEKDERHAEPFNLGLQHAANLVYGQNKTKTREQVLEEALREIADGCGNANFVARRALEWKP